jgi:hypothetical protein
MAITVQDPFTGAGVVSIDGEERFVVKLPPADEMILDRCASPCLFTGRLSEQLFGVPRKRHVVSSQGPLPDRKTARSSLASFACSWRTVTSKPELRHPPW